MKISAILGLLLSALSLAARSAESAKPLCITNVYVVSAENLGYIVKAAF